MGMSIIKIDEFEMDEDDFRTLLNKYSVSDLIELESILKYIDDKDINLAIKEALNSKINDPKINSSELTEAIEELKKTFSLYDKFQVDVKKYDEKYISHVESAEN